MKLMKLLSMIAVMAVMAWPAFSSTRDIYPDPAQAHADLAAALKQAGATHKRVIVDFGGNWCGDCHVLDMYFHNAENQPILDANYILVHVNVGHYDANLDLAQRYGIPLEKGVPALVVLSETGKVLLSQKSGEFESMRRLQPSTITSFLVQWKPTKPGCSVMAVTC